jgi:competence protein ComEA
MKTVMYIFIGILLGLLLAGGIWVAARTPEGESVTLIPAPTPEPLRVHVAGAVVRPGVYALPEDGRIEDAVEAAGGFVVEADKNALNLAAFLEDGERLDIPYVEGYEPATEEEFAVTGTPSPNAGEDLVNINTASLDELVKLPRIGEAIAQRIIDYRDDNGSFTRIEDIKNVTGIGESIFDEIKDLITVEG